MGSGASYCSCHSKARRKPPSKSNELTLPQANIVANNDLSSSNSNNDNFNDNNQTQLESHNNLSPLEIASRNGNSRESHPEATPRSNEAQYSSIPYTPQGEDAQVYRYYCPLCMEYYRSILKLKCCDNYICKRCSTEYINNKGYNLNNSLHGDSAMESVPCPHCMRSGFYLTWVNNDETVRDYSSKNNIESSRNNTKVNPLQPSPLKVGDSFEALKRKMVPYQTAIQVSDLSIPSPTASGFCPKQSKSSNSEQVVGDVARFTPRVRSAGIADRSFEDDSDINIDNHQPTAVDATLNISPLHNNLINQQFNIDQMQNHNNSRSNSRSSSRADVSEYNHIVGIAVDPTSAITSPRSDLLSLSTTNHNIVIPNALATEMVRDMLDSAVIRRSNNLITPSIS